MRGGMPWKSSNEMTQLDLETLKQKRRGRRHNRRRGSSFRIEKGSSSKSTTRSWRPMPNSRRSRRHEDLSMKRNYS